MGDVGGWLMPTAQEKDRSDRCVDWYENDDWRRYQKWKMQIIPRYEAVETDDTSIGFVSTPFEPYESWELNGGDGEWVVWWVIGFYKWLISCVCKQISKSPFQEHTSGVWSLQSTLISILLWENIFSDSQQKRESKQIEAMISTISKFDFKEL